MPSLITIGVGIEPRYICMGGGHDTTRPSGHLILIDRYILRHNVMCIPKFNVSLTVQALYMIDSDIFIPDCIAFLREHRNIKLGFIIFLVSV